MLEMRWETEDFRGTGGLSSMLSSSLESSESSSSILLSFRSLRSSGPCVLLEADSRGESRDRSEDGGSGLGTETETDLLVRERAGDASTGDLSTASSKESCSVVYFVSTDVTPDPDAVCRVTAGVRQGGAGWTYHIVVVFLRVLGVCARLCARRESLFFFHVSLRLLRLLFLLLGVSLGRQRGGFPLLRHGFDHSGSVAVSSWLGAQERWSRVEYTRRRKELMWPLDCRPCTGFCCK